MARITVEDCIDKFPSRFELVLVASQRARKLHSGDAPAIEKDNDKNTVIALREIADSAFTVNEMKENLIQEYQTVTLSDEEEENVEIESLDSIEQINLEKKETETETKTNIQAETDTNTNTNTGTNTNTSTSTGTRTNPPAPLVWAHGCAKASGNPQSLFSSQ